MLLCWALIAIAVPARPGWYTMTQSDGSTIKLRAVGNAFNNALLTTDGLALCMLGHETIVGLCRVILVESVELYEFDEAIGILGIGGVTSGFQSTRPSFVVGSFQGEQRAVTLTVGQET